jgi:DNA invertase Pin-like site-specific DNA recombinase
MTETRTGYARCSTDRQDLTAQRDALMALGVAEDRIYVDHGLTGRTRARPGLDQAIAAVRSGDTLVVTKLDRLARSVPDARAIADQLAARGVKLALGGTIHDPTDPMGRMFFNILATFAEFESDLIRMRTREGMAVARARGKLRGKNPSSRIARRGSCAGCTTPAIIQSAIWPRSSRCPAPRCTARCSGRGLRARADCAASPRAWVTSTIATKIAKVASTGRR